MSRKPTAKILLLFLAFTFFICLIVCEISLRFLSSEERHVSYFLGKKWRYIAPFAEPEISNEITANPGDYRIYDPDLGWALGQWGNSEPLYFSDGMGLRCSEEHFKKKISKHENGVVDVICIGDSFTHGDEVSYEGSYPYQLSQIGMQKVANLGVGGYGIDQAVLRYEKLKQLKTDWVVIGVISGDLERARTQVYSLYHGGTKSKPLFVKNDQGALVVKNQPAIFGDALKEAYAKGKESAFFRREYNLSEAMFESHWYDVSMIIRIMRSIPAWQQQMKEPIYRTPGPAMDFSIQIFERLRKKANERGAKVLILLLGNTESFKDREMMDDPWKVMREKLLVKEFNVLDTSEMSYVEYQKNPASVINREGVHYTKEMNARVAEEIHRYLEKVSK